MTVNPSKIDAQAIVQRASGDPRQEFGSFFLLRLLGMEVEHEPDACTVAFEVRPELFNPQGSLHGGVLATALDISMGHLLQRQVSAGATLEMKTQFFKPVRAGIVRCRASFLRMGRRISFLQSEALDDQGGKIAYATATWTLL